MESLSRHALDCTVKSGNSGTSVGTAWKRIRLLATSIGFSWEKKKDRKNCMSPWSLWRNDIICSLCSWFNIVLTFDLYTSFVTSCLGRCMERCDDHVLTNQCKQKFKHSKPNFLNMSTVLSDVKILSVHNVSFKNDLKTASDVDIHHLLHQNVVCPPTITSLHLKNLMFFLPSWTF